MQNDLQLLIAELQQEHDLLQSELDKCLMESDYKGAKWYQKALGYTAEKLRTLKNLENPHYSNIQDLRRMIDRMKNLDTRAIDPELVHIHKAFNDQQIPPLENKLAQLENTEKKFQLDSDEIQTHLEKLVSGQSNQFEIEISNPPISLSFRTYLGDLKIEISANKSDSLEPYIASHRVATMRTLGFDISSKSAVKQIHNVSVHDIPAILQLISVLAFEIFNLYGGRKAILLVEKNHKG